MNLTPTKNTNFAVSNHSELAACSSAIADAFLEPTRLQYPIPSRSDPSVHSSDTDVMVREIYRKAAANTLAGPNSTSMAAQLRVNAYSTESARITRKLSVSSSRNLLRDYMHKRTQQYIETKYLQASIHNNANVIKGISKLFGHLAVEDTDNSLDDLEEFTSEATDTMAAITDTIRHPCCPDEIKYDLCRLHMEALEADPRLEEELRRGRELITAVHTYNPINDCNSANSIIKCPLCYANSAQ